MEKLSHLLLGSDAPRAIRTALAFGLALMSAHALGHREAGVFMAIAAQGIAMADLRGPYEARLAVLGSLALLMGAAAMLGVLTAHSVGLASLAMALIAITGGLLRHLSPDYGPSLSIYSIVLFVFALGQPGHRPEALHLGLLVGAGCTVATLIQIAFWPVRPQHPVRAAVAETWTVISELIAALHSEPEQTEALSRENAIDNAERELRASLDRSFIILASVESQRPPALFAHLEAMRREAVHLSMRLIALNTVLDQRAGRPGDATSWGALRRELESLRQATRAVAVALITHRGAELRAADVLLRRCEQRLARLSQAPETSVVTAPVDAALGHIAAVLPAIRKNLSESYRHGLAGMGLPKNGGEWARHLKGAVASWVRPKGGISPVNLKHTLRMMVLTTLSVALYLGLHIPRGFWLPLTVAVVLQPDYGATRRRAFERMAGTLGGSLLGSAFIGIQLPLLFLDGCATLTAFGFAYFFKRRYAVAVFFLTLSVVLLSETLAPLTLQFTLSRLGANVLGGVAALMAALFIFPHWEGATFTTRLARALRFNAAFLQTMLVWDASGLTREPLPLLIVRRRAENAQRSAGTSLNRLLGEPDSRQVHPERARMLVEASSRLTRILTALTVHLVHGGRLHGEPVFTESATAIGHALETLALFVENDFAEPAPWPPHLETLTRLAAQTPPDTVLWPALLQMLNELRTLKL